MADKATVAIPDDNNDLMQVVRLTVMNVNGISEQMGLVLKKIDDHSNRISHLEDRLSRHEQTETISRAECRRIRKAVMNRVNSVLKIEFDGGTVAKNSIKTDVLYRGGFISRCYTDAKNHSKMGESYSETLKVDFDEVMRYVESWHPEVEGGVEGYKHYLDIRREEREKRNHK